MYTHILNVQILISLLKEFNIKEIVMAPGGSDIPLIHSIENDDFFNCYSIVDERSLVYFAMGIAQHKRTPVVCICTSGTAVSNFLPGITEAFYQDVPIIAITADKNPNRLNQLETQKTDQNIFSTVCKKVVNLPVIRCKEEQWLCERLVNEALLELNHHGTGPVQINIPIIGKISVFNKQSLPKVKKISRVDINAPKSKWEECRKIIENKKRILIIVGENIYFSDKDINNIELFFEKYNCAISVEHLSNLKCKGTLRTYALTDANDKNIFELIKPDLVVSMGNNFASAVMKPFLRRYSGQCVHWQIDSAGRIRDMFNSLEIVFECSVGQFFEKINENANCKNNMEYYNEIKKCIDKINIEDVDFSDFWVVKKIAEVIPENAVLHTGILNSTRLMQYFDIPNSVINYSNVGALGIDGCLSSFMGQAISTDELAYCILGDLSYFYDMNATGIRNVKNNVRIILLNNGGGAEFHYLVGKNNIKTINDYISAEHQNIAMGWVQSLNYDYYSVRNKADFENIIPLITNKSEKPIFVEVFTKMEDDTKVIKDFYSKIRLSVGGTKSKIKDTVKSFLTDEQKMMAKKMLAKLMKR